MKDGIILIDKPKGDSSAKVLARVKHKLGVRKIGHAGTLDPMATGLLVCLVNGATKMADKVQSGKKTYTGVIKFGIITDSDDITGNVISKFDDLVDLSKLPEIMKSFRGEITQLPPKISALKVGGVRAYKLARSGEAFELKPRTATIDLFEVEKITDDEIRFKVICSKGTYVRALARDIGEALGCGGCLKELRREASEPFDVKNAKLVEALSENDILSVESVSL